jgi:hypothetical protein
MGDYLNFESLEIAARRFREVVSPQIHKYFPLI